MKMNMITHFRGDKRYECEHDRPFTAENIRRMFQLGVSWRCVAERACSTERNEALITEAETKRAALAIASTVGPLEHYHNPCGHC